MDILEKAKSYAEEKAIKGINALVEQAYIDGYNDGMKHHENEMLDRIKDGVEYIDFGLETKTLWSKELLSDNGFCREMTYLEASKLDIPTKEQFEELFSQYCKVEYNNANDRGGFEFKNIHGDLMFVRGFINNKLFWLKDDEDSTERNYASIKLLNGKWEPVVKKIFMGEKLPVMLVMNK